LIQTSLTQSSEFNANDTPHSATVLTSDAQLSADQLVLVLVDLVPAWLNLGTLQFQPFSLPTHSLTKSDL